MDKEFEKFAARVHKELVPRLKNSDVFVSITPVEDVDIKFAVELGLAIMLDKPVIAVVRPGTKIPEKLSKVVDRFIEMDIKEPGNHEKLAAAISEAANEIMS